MNGEVGWSRPCHPESGAQSLVSLRQGSKPTTHVQQDRHQERGLTMRINVRLCTGVVAVTLLAGAPAQAQLGGTLGEAINSVGEAGARLDKGRLKIMSPIPQPGRDYTKVYLHNQTGKRVFVAILYAHFEASG